MQTFLPYPNFARSVQVLDNQRLGKQRVEVLQLLKALAGETKGWRNHPCTRMWAGCELALADYGVAACTEWVSRGFRDTCSFQIRCYRTEFAARGCGESLPQWLGYDRFHASHRSNLLRKSDWYRQFGWTEPDNLEYYWPIVINGRFFHG